MSQTTASRHCIRLPCQLSAEIQFSGGNSTITKKAVISNISTTGIQILCPSFVATGQTLTASFKVPGQGKPTAFQAEVMRIESLQGRMPGHFPYALGARFVSQPRKQEQKIGQFIEQKLTCSTERKGLGFLIFLLGIIPVAEILANGRGLATPTYDLFLMGNQLHSIWNLMLSPWLTLVISTGLILTAVLGWMNRPSFITHGLIWLKSQIIITLIQLSLTTHWIAENSEKKSIWIGKVVLWIFALSLFISLIQLIKRLKETQKLLSAEKISPGKNHPTFTIL